jgi:hypothetical protein
VSLHFLVASNLDSSDDAAPDCHDTKAVQTCSALATAQNRTRQPPRRTVGSVTVGRVGSDTDGLGAEVTQGPGAAVAKGLGTFQ